MPTDGELRTWFQNLGNTRPRAAESGIALDPASVIRRSRRRRLPRQLAVGGTVTLAVAGIGVAGVTGFRALVPGATGDSTTSVTDSAAENSPEDGNPGANAASGGIQQAPSNKLNLCGGELAEIAPSQTGLVLTPSFAASVPNGTEPVDGTVTMTNTGTERVTGITAASPAITVSQGGIVHWHSNGPMAALGVGVDLAPGQSMEYPASFVPVSCDVADDMADTFRADLPSLPAGKYRLSAAIDLITHDPTGETRSEPVTGSPATITVG